MPCVKNQDGSLTCNGGGFSVLIAKDGAILVKAGDSLSKYSMAIEGDFNHLNDFKHRRDKKIGAINEADLKTIENINYIMTGETLYHIPTRQKWRQGFTPLPDQIKQIQLPIVLEKVSKRNNTACMVKKLFALQGQPQNKWKASWFDCQKMELLGNKLAKEGTYQNSKETYYFNQFNNIATNPLQSVLLQREWKRDNLNEFVKRCNWTSEAISKHLSKLTYANGRAGTSNKPRAIFIGEHLRRMMKDNTTILSCYKDDWSPGGFPIK